MGMNLNKLPETVKDGETWHPPPGDLPDPGIEPTSLVSPALAGGFSTGGATGKALLTTATSQTRWT